MERTFSAWWEGSFQSKETKRIRLRGKSTQTYKVLQWMGKNQFWKLHLKDRKFSVLRRPQITHLNTFTAFYIQSQPLKIEVEISGESVPRLKSVCVGGTLLQNSSSKSARWMILKIIYLPLHPLIFSFCFNFSMWFASQLLLRIGYSVPLHKISHKMT